MAQSISSATMSRVNRRFLFLALILAALSAVLVYTALTRSSDSGGSTSTGPTVPVVVASVPIPAGATITAEMLDIRDVPENQVGTLAYSDIESAVGEVTRYPIETNEQVLFSKVVAGSTEASNDVLRNIIEAGERGMAVRAEAVIGAGGLVLPGDYVDVFWVGDEFVEDVTGAQLLAEDVEVLAVEQTLVDIPVTAPGLQEGEEATPSTGNAGRVPSVEAVPIPEAVTVTLMLTPQEVQRVFCGDESGSLRLAVRAFGDHAPSGIAPVDCVIIGSEQN